MTHKKKNTLFIVGAILLGILVISAIISLGTRLGSSQSYDKLSSSDYVVGTLNTAGEFDKSAECFVTEDYITVDGLKVIVEDDANLSYKLFFYDENKTFISNTSAFAVTYNGLIPETAEYFKIVIDPTNDSDISLYDIIKYSSDVDVKYYK